MGNKYDRKIKNSKEMTKKFNSNQEYFNWFDENIGLVRILRLKFDGNKMIVKFERVELR